MHTSLDRVPSGSMMMSGSVTHPGDDCNVAAEMPSLLAMGSVCCSLQWCGDWLDWSGVGLVSLSFVTPDNFLQYTVMAFGMWNAPATFQRPIQRVLSSVTNCKAYLDDMVVYSDTWGDHVTTLCEVLTRLAKALLTVNLAKCEFGKAVVTYLGKQVGQGEVHPVNAKVEAIMDFPIPKTKPWV